MRTLKDILTEGILDDIEVTMQAGDKFDKWYKAAAKELNNIKILLSSLKNWHGGEYENIDGDRVNNGIGYDYQIFVKCSQLSKRFSLPGKNLYITLQFIPARSNWYINFEFTNAREMTQNPNCVYRSFINSFKQVFGFSYVETSFTQGEGKHSKYTPQEIIDKYILPNFSDIETCEKEIVEISHELEKHNCPVKYFNARPI